MDGSYGVVCVSLSMHTQFCSIDKVYCVEAGVRLCQNNTVFMLIRSWLLSLKWRLDWQNINTEDFLLLAVDVFTECDPEFELSFPPCSSGSEQNGNNGRDWNIPPV